MVKTMNSVCAKVLILIACTLAGMREYKNEVKMDRNETCGRPCHGLNETVRIWHVLTPTCIAFGVWLVIAMPTLLMRSRYKAVGIKSLVWVVGLLWVNLVASYAWYKENKVQGYVWAVHSGSQVLAEWKDLKKSNLLGSIHPWLTGAGIIGIAGFAWQNGPSVGLVPWGGLAHCGWVVHMTAVIGLEVFFGVCSLFI